MCQLLYNILPKITIRSSSIWLIVETASVVLWLAWTSVDRGFEPLLGKTKDYKIGICCFSTKRAALRSKSKDGLAWNQNNESKWSDMSTRGLLFQWASTMKTQRVAIL
jgi:hypothetical protein